MFNTVIFDMDGVLIDSQPLHFHVDMEVLRTYGGHPVFADIEKHAGQTNHDRWPMYQQEFNGLPDVDELIKTHTEILMRLFRESDLQAIPGIPELLADLKAQGMKTAVASSSSIDLINLVLEKLGIAAFFDQLVTGDDLPKGKPAPDIFLKAAEVLKSQIQECIVIEDSANGVLAAKNAGMYCVAFRNPNSGKQDLSKADRIIDDFRGFRLA